MTREETLQLALVDLRYLAAGAALPQPYDTATGVAGRSAVWMLAVPGPHGAETQLVAKFDEPARQAKEWEKIAELRGLNVLPQAMLPVAMNCPGHGVIIYQDASALTPGGKAVHLQKLLLRQLATNVGNCVEALQMGLGVLHSFYGSQPGAMRLLTEGKAFRWSDWLPSKGKTQSGMSEGAQQAYPAIDMSGGQVAISNGCVLPNPLPAYWERAAETEGRTMVSRIHGDMNLTNLLVGLSGNHKPLGVFIIDLADSKADAPTVIDYARLETEFWHEVFAVLPGGGPEAMLTVRRMLDAEEGSLALFSPVQRGAVEFVQALRQDAFATLRGTLPDYVLADYMRAVYFLHGRALAYPSVQDCVAKCQAAFLGAASALEFIQRLEAGQVTRPPLLPEPNGDGSGSTGDVQATPSSPPVPTVPSRPEQGVEDETGAVGRASIAFVLEVDRVSFDGPGFLRSLESLVGIQSAQIRIVSVTSGSTVVEVDGPDELLYAIHVKLSDSQELLTTAMQLLKLREYRFRGSNGAEYTVHCKANGDAPYKEAKQERRLFPGHLPNPLYVVCCRICGIKEMVSDQVAAAVQVLSEVCQQAAGEQELKVCRTLPSVYGRILCVCEAVPALKSAERILGAAASRGVTLAIGVSMGRLEVFRDIARENLVGPAVNLAARLAFTEEAELNVVVQPAVRAQVIQASTYRVASFTSQVPASGQVKRTPLEYFTLRGSLPTVGLLPAPGKYETVGADVVVYDIARFSEKNPDGQWDVVTKLNRAAVQAAQSVGADLLWREDALWYGPAGDGGVLVFGQGKGDMAWQFAQELNQVCRHDKTEIRLGLAHGQTVVVGDNLPVGMSILRADQLSGIPPTWGYCVDAGFWDLRARAVQRRWRATHLRDDERALVLEEEQREVTRRAEPLGLKGDQGSAAVPVPAGTDPPFSGSSANTEGESASTSAQTRTEQESRQEPSADLKALLRGVIHTTRNILSRNLKLAEELRLALCSDEPQRRGTAQDIVEMTLAVGLNEILVSLHGWLRDQPTRSDAAQIRDIIDAMLGLAVEKPAWLETMRVRLPTRDELADQASNTRCKPVDVPEIIQPYSAELLVSALLDSRARWNHASGATARTGRGYVPVPSPLDLPPKSDKPQWQLETIKRNMLRALGSGAPADHAQDDRRLRERLLGAWKLGEPLHTVLGRDEEVTRLLQNDPATNLLLVLKKADGQDDAIPHPEELSLVLDRIYARLDELDQVAAKAQGR